MALLKILKTAIDTLQKLQTQMIPEAHKAAQLTDAALQLGIRCLSYDFVGHASLAHTSQARVLNCQFSEFCTRVLSFSEIFVTGAG